MKRKARAVTTIATILFCFCAGTSADATNMPAATATIGQATEAAPSTIVELIVVIRDAKDVGTAARSYSKARMLDKDDVEVYEEYMKKMLTLGHPKIALYPALELRRLKAKNGTAWAVMGYNDARRGSYLTAFTSTICGMRLLPDDPGIQHNAGILLAWYESRRVKPKLTADLQAVLEEKSEKWLEKAKYAEAHRKSKSEFTARAERIERLKADVASAEKAARTAARESSQATARYRKYARAIASLEDDVKVLTRSYESASRYRRTETDYERRRRYRLIADTRSKISAKEMRISSLKRETYSLRTEAMKEAKFLSKAKKTLAKARTALRAEERIKPSLTWLPPAVDGVITPEDPTPPRFAAHAGPASQPSAGPAPEVQLKMAKLLLQNKRRQRAMAILVVIVKKHPNTKAAKEAADLLRKLRRSGLEQL